MITINHKFLTHQINPETETLILGTFNPDAEDNQAEFFYGRVRNHLWKLLPIAFKENDLKNSSKLEKLEFIKTYKIDFIDLISEVEVEDGQEVNYDDSYIDDKVTKWNNVIYEIDKLKGLKRVCFTRKTFADIPIMRKRVELIQAHCTKKEIPFTALISPTRFYNEKKQTEWNKVLTNELKES
jgi:G:T/U-mismatch repair DNA glycosylase